MPKYTRFLKIPGKSSQELYLKLAEDIDCFLETTSLSKVKVEISKDQALKQLCIKSPVVKAILMCQDGALQVNADLSLFAAPFRSKIDEGIDRWLGRAFPEIFNKTQDPSSTPPPSTST